MGGFPKVILLATLLSGGFITGKGSICMKAVCSVGGAVGGFPPGRRPSSSRSLNLNASWRDASAFFKERT